MGKAGEGFKAKRWWDMAKAVNKFKDDLQYRQGKGNIYTLHLDVEDPNFSTGSSR